MIAIKLSLLLSPFPLAALLLLPGGRPAPLADGNRVAGEESAEERACAAANTRLHDETVRVAWTRIGTVHRDVEAFYCIFRGDEDAPLDFVRNAERIRFSLVGTGDEMRTADIGFRVTTNAADTITLGPASVGIAPRNRRSCRVEICTAFTRPGERVISVEVLTN
jgi:hypothetical protein